MWFRAFYGILGVSGGFSAVGVSRGCRVFRVVRSLKHRVLCFPAKGSRSFEASSELAQSPVVGFWGFQGLKLCFHGRGFGRLVEKIMGLLGLGF